MKTALTIAGSDPTGGAGLQADLRVFRTFGLHGLSIPSALTAQNTRGISMIMPVEREFFKKQLDTLLEDIRPDSTKTGMLYSSWLIEDLAERIKAYSLKNLVIDPVTVSSSGTSLVEDSTLDRIRELLFPLSTVITPNIYEASLFTGINITDEHDMESAAIELKEMGPQAVIITGGHLETLAIDLYYDGITFQRIEAIKIKGEYHGTGCAFSAALTAGLASGASPLQSAKKAKEIVTEGIRKAYHPGNGMGILNI